MIEDEEEKLRATALANASAILQARNRAENALRAAEEVVRRTAEDLRLALAAGNLGNWRWERGSDVLYLSNQAAEIFGVSAAQTMTWTALRDSVVHPEDREADKQALDVSVSAHCDYDSTHRILRPDGEERWIAAKGRCSRSDDGAVIGMIGVVQDITARKRSEAALADETRVLELLNKTGAAIASKLELEELVQTVTDAATSLSNAKFGAFFYNVANLEGESFFLYALSGAPRAAFQDFPLPRNTPIFGPTFRGEGVVRSDDITKDPRYGKIGPHFGMPKGHLPVVSYLAVPVISRSGEVIGGLFFGHNEPGVFTERTERIVLGVAAQAAVAIDNARLYEAAQRSAREREALLESERSARAEAQRSSELKDEFLTTLSHELRTPLSAILGWSQLLRKNPPEHEVLVQALETIERNARVQTQLIEGLLDMSQITSGKLRLNVQPIDLVSIVDASIQTIETAAAAKEIRIERMLDPLPGPISGDAARLQQVMWNLLSNAIKFTPKGGKVQVMLSRVSSHIELSVADNGIGIPQAFLEHAFERFRQADSTTTRKYGGLGIGLAIVKKLVELHGGSVHVYSEGEDKGATFVVHLPTSAVQQSTSYKGSSFHVDEPETDLTGIRVLIVDDERDARELVKRLLSEHGAEVTTVGNAADALRAIRESPPDLMISDIGMPETDGYQLLRQIRALKTPEALKMPAIALTAFARTEDRTRAMREGYMLHIAKPVDPSELVVAVANVARRM